MEVCGIIDIDHLKGVAGSARRAHPLSRRGLSMRVLNLQGERVGKFSTCVAIFSCLPGGLAFAEAPHSGLHLGVNATYATVGDDTEISGESALAQTNFVDSGSVASSIPVDAKGFGVGAQIGYDWSISDRAFLGVEADLNGVNLEETGSQPGPSDPSRIMTSRLSLNYLATVRARAGYWFTERLEGHVSAGLASGDAELTTALTRTPSCTGNNCQMGSASETLTGWAAGIGGEYILSDRIGLRFDYSHYDLGELSHRMTDPAFPATVFIADADVSGDAIQAGLSWHF
ncbi:MAG: outer membrane beta-barrel protein [Terricaulis sp.]